MNLRKPGKILFLTTADNIGGMERVVCGLAKGFQALGWEVRTVFPSTAKSPALLKWCREQGVDAEETPALLDAAASHSPKQMVSLLRFVRRVNPDVINIHYGDNFISLKDMIAVRLAGLHRLVVTVHHPTPWDETNVDKKGLTRKSAHLASSITVPSAATRNVLIESGIPKSRIHVIPCGLEAPTKCPSRAEVRSRLGLPQGAFLVGALARLVPHKGVADLITAASQVPDPHGELLVVVAGDGPERASLESLAANRLKDRAVFLGRIPDVNDFYAACDIFALPSYLEGFGLVYVEAAFQGVTSIATTAGGAPDAVEDGVTGILVNPGDIDAIACAIVKLRDDTSLRQRLSEAARTRAYKEFTHSAMADSYLRLF